LISENYNTKSIVCTDMQFGDLTMVSGAKYECREL